MAGDKIALILGSGPRVGAAVTAKLASDGYKIAIVSRKGTNSVTEQGYLWLQADFAKPDAGVISSLFDHVEEEFHGVPSIVIYNAASLTPPSDKDSALSIPEARITNDLNVNVTTPIIAAEQAIKRWDAAPAGTARLFIYTGNIMNVAMVPVPLMLNLGVGKAASAYWIALADNAYAAKGYRIIYADQRQPDGKFTGPALDGPAHGEFYSHLAASDAKDVPWHATFVKGEGYVKF